MSEPSRDVPRPVEVDLPLMHLGCAGIPSQATASASARSTFCFGALALLVAFAPLFLFMALRIKLNDRGTVFFQGSQSPPGRAVPLASSPHRPETEACSQALRVATSYDSGLFRIKDNPRSRNASGCITSPSTSSPSCGTSSAAT